MYKNGSFERCKGELSFALTFHGSLWVVTHGRLFENLYSCGASDFNALLCQMGLTWPLLGII